MILEDMTPEGERGVYRPHFIPGPVEIIDDEDIADGIDRMLTETRERLAGTDTDPTAVLPQAEVDAALAEAAAERAAMVEPGAEFTAPKCPECKGTGVSNLTSAIVTPCPACLQHPGLAPPATHQPRPIRSQEQRETADAAAKAAKVASRAKQNGGATVVEHGGES